MAKLLIIIACSSVMLGCINSYTCEGDHKEVYWNISPTTNDNTPVPTDPTKPTEPQS